MSKADALRVPNDLAHIVKAIVRIHRYVDGMAEAAFLGDEKTQDAVVRNFEILGEPAHTVEKLHPAFAASHAQVPWALMYTMRNRVAHGAWRMATSRWTTSWSGNTIHADLPQLRALVAALLAGGAAT